MTGRWAFWIDVPVAAVVAIILQGTHDHRRPDVLARAQTDASIRPAWTDPLATTVQDLQQTPRLHMPYGAGVVPPGSQHRSQPRAQQPPPRVALHRLDRLRPAK